MFGRVPRRLRPRLTRDERVLGWAHQSVAAPATTGTAPGAVVVTVLGLWLPGRAERLGWHEIHKAAWAGSRLTVTPSRLVAERAGYEVVADTDDIAVNLVKPGDVPHVVRERVNKSVAFTAHHDLPGGGVRVVARRVPGVDGLRWQVRYDEGTPDDPDLVAGLVAEAAEA